MATYPPDIEAYVQEKIASGQFRTREELTTEAVRLYREVETSRARVKSDVQAAIAEANSGLSEPLDIEAIKVELAAELDSSGRPL